MGIRRGDLNNLYVREKLIFFHVERSIDSCYTSEAEQEVSSEARRSKLFLVFQACWDKEKSIQKSLWPLVPVETALGIVATTDVADQDFHNPQNPATLCMCEMGTLNGSGAKPLILKFSALLRLNFIFNC